MILRVSRALLAVVSGLVGFWFLYKENGRVGERNLFWTNHIFPEIDFIIRTSGSGVWKYNINDESCFVDFWYESRLMWLEVKYIAQCEDRCTKKGMTVYGHTKYDAVEKCLRDLWNLIKAQLRKEQDEILMLNTENEYGRRFQTYYQNMSVTVANNSKTWERNLHY